MNCKTDAEYYNYLCNLETNILHILCAKFTNINYHIDLLKNFVKDIKKVPKKYKLTCEKRSIMLEQLGGIIRAYDLVYVSQKDDDSDSSRSGNGSSEEDFVLPVSSNNFQKN